MTLRPSDITIALERLPFDDETLLCMHQALLTQIAEKEKQLIKSRYANKNNYLHYTISRLAYGFVKEEYESVLYEMKLRGLSA
ncbi:MAG: hypothetical protein LBS84_03455 [Clostridiales bacterium]|jgi:hypothetical protein|nr:hypothetical protein [Clostridiales bacterium]